ncbi:hypothetical protein GQ55_2G385700 [Panicum hallii var. hallii]|uniref:Uncharacterized protein n=1 Tax=Panicum hallii var. hallii TaxID=1504633 RepID=A0A2T7EWX5_9POAL|nr:hypothetical protein GQ55_2G385700 [Panicum hallii var. hallii]
MVAGSPPRSSSPMSAAKLPEREPHDPHGSRRHVTTARGIHSAERTSQCPGRRSGHWKVPDSCSTKCLQGKLLTEPTLDPEVLCLGTRLFICADARVTRDGEASYIQNMVIGYSAGVTIGSQTSPRSCGSSSPFELVEGAAACEGLQPVILQAHPPQQRHLACPT